MQGMLAAGNGQQPDRRAQGVSPEVSPVSVIDRFGFTLFIAVAVHLIIILGVGFEAETPQPLSRTLEVTLAQFQSESAPERADFIASHNQVGSGEADDKRLLSTTEKALFQTNDAQPLAAQQQAFMVQEVVSPTPTPAVSEQQAPQPERQTSARHQDALDVLKTTAEKAVEVKETRKERPDMSAPPSGSLASSLVSRSLEIAALEARLDIHKELNSRQPRVRRLYSASTRESFDASYLDSWRRKVERVGNLNYPEEARRRELFGSLRLLVVITPEGELQRVQVLKSSGHKVLDDAAVRIVRLAAPYAPFPAAMRKRADLVEIIRTWKFEKARFDING